MLKGNLKQNFILALGLLLFTNLISQNQPNKKLLIYTEGEGHLQPLIETLLKDLDNIKTDKPYFQSVNTFNNFIRDNKYQGEFSNLLLLIKPADSNLEIYYTDKEIEIRRRIFEVLLDYQYLLKINTKTLGELIEFQFQLYETIKSEKNNVPSIISNETVKVENIFINPKDSNYKDELSKSLKRLFDFSNSLPVARLKIYEENIKQNDVVVVSSNRELKLDGSSSGDLDSPELEYIWRNIPFDNEDFQTSSKLLFAKNNYFSIQKVKIPEKGRFKIGFKVFDGINYSDEIIFELVAYKSPIKIDVLNPKVYSYNRQTARRHSNLKEGILYFEKDNDTNLRKEEIIISKKKLGGKYYPEFHNDYIYKNFKVLNDSLRNSGRIVFSTKFSEPRISRNNELFLYTVGENNLLGDPVLIVHQLINRIGVSVRFGILTTNIIDSYTTDEPYNEGVQFSSSNEAFNFEFGYYILKSLEIGIGYTFGRRTRDEIENYLIIYPYDVSFFANYYFLSDYDHNRFNPFVGIKSFHYEYESPETNEEYTVANVLSPNIGINYSVSRFKVFDLNLNIALSYNILNEKKLPKANGISLFVGTQLRI